MTAVASEMLDHWAGRHLGEEGGRIVKTILVYAFSLSALVAAPIGIVATRLVADRVFARDAAGVPGIMLAALALGGGAGVLAGALIFGLLAGLPLVHAMLATATLTWLGQIWIAAPLLTALRRYRAVPIAYLTGIVVAAGILMALPHPGVTTVLAVIAGGVGSALAAVTMVIRRRFGADAVLPSVDAISPRLAVVVAAAGVAGVAAIWIDKWVLWMGPGSVRTLGLLRLNPINDQGSFLGLLTLIPGLTLLLIVTETRFDRRFADMIARCTGTSTLARIEEARSDLVATMADGLRMLVLVQILVAAIAWVFAVPLFDLIGADARAVFAFRQTSVGAIFHIVAIAATVVLAYYDLFGRILLTWAAFAIGSAVATMLQWDVGFAAFGWGYMAGAVIGASVGLAQVAEATVHLTYLIFVGNNPAVIGRGGRLL